VSDLVMMGGWTLVADYYKKMPKKVQYTGTTLLDFFPKLKIS
jgi:hypothetical protein